MFGKRRGEQLRMVNGMECFFPLNLNHNAAVDHQIGAEPARKLHFPVYQRDGLLPLLLQP